MKCNDVKKQWQAYINGQLSDESEQKIDDHIEHCEVCQKQLESIAEQTENINIDKLLNKAKRKHQIKIIGLTLISIITLYILTNVASIILYEIGDKTEKARRTEQAYFQLTNANYVLEPTFSNIQPLFKMEYDVTVTKRVGKGDIVIAEQHPKLIFNKFTNLQFSHPVDKTKLQFINRTKTKGLTSTNAWDTLEYLPEGSVSELALTFSNSMNFEETIEYLSKYDVDLVWSGIETNDLTNLEEDLIPGINVVGLSTQAIQSDLLIYNELTNGKSLNKEYPSANYKTLWNDTLNYLLNNQNYVKQLNKEMSMMTVDIESIKDFTDTNGINLYGVVITGPTKELLKFKDNQQVLHATVGEATLWNWQ